MRFLADFYQSFATQGTEVELSQLLEAREQRAALQQQCLTRYQQPILSLTLTAVGSVKKNALLDYVFEQALHYLSAEFETLEISPTAQFIRPFITGHEAIFVLPINAIKLKQAMIALEQRLPIARLWDLDVIDFNGKPLSRLEVGYSPRECLLCDCEAKLCVRERMHQLDDIIAEIEQRAMAHRFAQYIATQVHKALLTEARLTPKPGLVDSRNSGAHQDMDLHLFEVSALALKSFWYDFVLQGMANATLAVSDVLAQIRPLGLRAEQAMLQATNGVNTHKGAIFSLGLVCTALGYLFQQKRIFNVETVCHTVAQICHGIVAELQAEIISRPLTAGEKLYKNYGLTGARGEAENGFPLIQNALPTLRHDRELLHSLRLVLLQLMAQNPDTNVAHRGGMEGLIWLQQYANNLLADERIYQDQTLLINKLEEFDQQCIARNLSAGGSADLLALTYFFFILSSR